MTVDPYYRRDLALVHERGYGFHGDLVAPGVLALLEPVRGGLVLELGCGTGALTRHLLAAGHRVLATDASPAMLEAARQSLGPAAQLALLALPDDPLPAADAVVSVGHPVSYLASAAEVDRALTSMAVALRPGGVLAIDICDLEWGTARTGTSNLGRVGPDWAIITEFSMPAPDKFVRDITTFVPDSRGAWRRDSEHHENVLIDTSRIPGTLRPLGVSAAIRASFGDETLPPGLKTVIGTRHLCPSAVTLPAERVGQILRTRSCGPKTPDSPPRRTARRRTAPAAPSTLFFSKTASPPTWDGDSTSQAQDPAPRIRWGRFLPEHTTAVSLLDSSTTRTSWSPAATPTACARPEPKEEPP